MGEQALDAGRALRGNASVRIVGPSIAAPLLALIGALLLGSLSACGGGGADSAAHFVVSEAATLFQPTRGAWGPDGRLYVLTLRGELVAYRLSEAYEVIDETRYPGVSLDGAPHALGLAFSPFDAVGPVRVYVAHAILQSDDSACQATFIPFSGAVSMLEAPGFDMPQPVLRGLPSSRRAHGINGLAFDDEGALYVCVGGVTNAGVPGCPVSGVPATPLSGSVLRCDVRAADFDGYVRYRDRTTDALVDDQLSAANADAVLGPGVEVFASGLRNTFDVCWTTEGELFATDNNATEGGGQASTSATTSVPVPPTQDELNRLTDGAYYGHPNRNRGRDDARQNRFWGSGTTSAEHTSELATFPPSTNGLVEYRATTAGGTYRGMLLAQQLSKATFGVRVEGGGAEVIEMPFALPALDVLVAPGGAIVGIDFIRGRVRIAQPPAPWPNPWRPREPQVLDVFPWRAPSSGGAAFEIGGFDLGGRADRVAVWFGGARAVVLSVSERRVRGVVPALGAEGLVDVRVELDGGADAGGVSLALPQAFRYLGAD